MAVHAPNTGAQMRAPETALPSISLRAIDLSTAFRTLAALVNGIDRLASELTIEPSQFENFDHVSLLMDLANTVINSSIDICGSIEIDARRFERVA